MNVFINLIFNGRISDEKLSAEEILRCFRETSCEEFVRRLNTLKSIIHHYYWYEGYMGDDDDEDNCGFVETTKLRPFIIGLDKIRQYLTVDDIVKYMSIDSELYFSEDFHKVYETNPQLAKELYIKYWNNSCYCDDWNIYSVSFSLPTSKSDNE
jgi:hypothetical protein